MDTLLQDMRYGMRMLAKSPIVTIIAVITLALGIGASTAIFSIINGFLFRPLTYKDPGRLVALSESNLKQGGTTMLASQMTFQDWQNSSQSFEQMGAFVEGSFNLAGSNLAERVQGARVSPGFFQTLGVEPFRGRAFHPEDGQSGAERVVIVSYSHWQRSHGGTPNLIGQVLKINAEPYTVIGIMPENFEFFGFAEVWLPINAQLTGLPAERKQREFEVIARLKPGVSLRQAQSEMDVLTARLAASYPDAYEMTRVNVVSFREFLVGEIGSAFPMLLGAVMLVLLIACSNVANLMLAKATTRQKEIAIRAALGANRARLIRQLLTESVLLALISVVLGVLLAVWAVEAMVAAIPVQIPLWLKMSIDLRVLGVTILTSMLVGVLFGLAPALQVSQPYVGEWLKEGGHRSGSRRGRKLRNALVIAETALAVILLSGAGLLTRSFIKLSEIDLGYDPHNVFSMEVELPQSKYQQNIQIEIFSEQVLERMKKLTGVKAAAISTAVSFGRQGSGETAFAAEGKPSGFLQEAVFYRAVTPAYFEVMDLALLAGRGFTEEDAKQNLGVAIINLELARRCWPGENAVGKHIKLGGTQAVSWLQVAGVIENSRTPGLYARGAEARSNLEVYLPYPQHVDRLLTILARTSSEPLAIATAASNAVLTVDPEQPVHNIKSAEETLSEAIWPFRAFSALLRLFALLGVVFVTVGIYGVIAYSAEQRTQEIGIRMALGAQPSDILKMITWQGVRLVSIGIFIGLPVAWLFSQAISGMLFNVSTVDPMTSALVLSILMIVAFAASLVPARRAMKINPIESLRQE